MFKQSNDKQNMHSGYGQNFQKRPISAKAEKQFKNIGESQEKQFKYVEFMKSLQSKLLYNSPKQKDKQKIMDSSNKRPKTVKNQQTSYNKITIDDIKVKNTPNVKENDKNIANRSQDKNKYFTNVQQKQKIQDKINQSTNNVFHSKQKIAQNQSLEQNDIKKQCQPDFKKLQNKMSNLESKIQQLKTNTSVEKKQTDNSIKNNSQIYNSLKNQIQIFFNKRGSTPKNQSAKNNEKKNLSVNTSPFSKNLNSSNSNGVQENKKKQNVHSNNVNSSIQKLNDFVTSVQKNSPIHQSLNNNQFSQNPANIVQKLNQSIQQKKTKSNSIREDHHIFYISNSIEAFINQREKTQYNKEHFLQCLSAMNFIKNIKNPSQTQINQKKKNLSQKDIHKGKKTLIFDLDETLIHCNDNQNVKSDVTLPIQFPTGEIINAGINIRPYAFQILKDMSELYEVMIFTASHSCYANVVLDYLDPQNKYIQHRLFRESCIHTEEGLYVKDLRVINRDMKDMIIVDNALYSFAFQIENGIPILNFYENKNDKELLDLMDYLTKLNQYKDVREYNKKMFKLKQFQNFQNPIQLFQNLFNQQLKQ